MPLNDIHPVVGVVGTCALLPPPLFPLSLSIMPVRVLLFDLWWWLSCRRHWSRKRRRRHVHPPPRPHLHGEPAASPLRLHRRCLPVCRGRRPLLPPRRRGRSSRRHASSSALQDAHRPLLIVSRCSSEPAATLLVNIVGVRCHHRLTRATSGSTTASGSSGTPRMGGSRSPPICHDRWPCHRGAPR